VPCLAQNFLVPGTGLEPARLAALDPKSSASANSATPAASKELILIYAHCLVRGATHCNRIVTETDSQIIGQLLGSIGDLRQSETVRPKNTILMKADEYQQFKRFQVRCVWSCNSGNLELSNRQFVFPGKPNSQGRGLASRMIFGSMRSIQGRVSNQTKAKLVFNVPRPSLVLEWGTLSR
jgi:hypothetical protein